jgi:hypothetical protein
MTAARGPLVFTQYTKDSVPPRIISRFSFRARSAYQSDGCPTAPVRYGTVQFVFTCGGADGVMGVNKDPRLKSYYEQPCA